MNQYSERSSLILFSLEGFFKLAVFVVAEAYGTGTLGCFHNCEGGIAHGTRVRQRFIPKDKITVGVVGAAIKSLAPSRLSFDNLARAPALSAADACGFEFDVFAVRVIAAGRIFAEAPVLECKVFPTYGAFFFQRNIVLDGRFLGGSNDLLGIAAFGIAGASHKLAESAAL